MKRFVLALIACIATLPALAGDMTFAEVRYAGDDGGAAVGSMQYRNPGAADSLRILRQSGWATTST